MKIYDSAKERKEEPESLLRQNHFYDDKEMLWKLIMDIWQFQRVKGSLLPILLLLEAMLGKCESVLTERSGLGNRF